MDNLAIQSSLFKDDINSRFLGWASFPAKGYLRIIKAGIGEKEFITEIITQLALHGSFNIIAGNEWLPDRDTLYRSIRRYTVKVQEVLERPKAMRPMTCLQLLDLLVEVSEQNKPILILDFLYHFYNADVDLDLRERIIKQCCEHLRNISLCSPTIVFVKETSTDKYHQFFPILASVADEITYIAHFPVLEESSQLFF